MTTATEQSTSRNMAEAKAHQNVQHIMFILKDHISSSSWTKAKHELYKVFLEHDIEFTTKEQRGRAS